MKQYVQSKGTGSRRIFHQMKHSYSGLTERVIHDVISSSTLSRQMNARFTNKAPFRPVSAHTVQEHLQIDLVDMSNRRIHHHGTTYSYILSVLDNFSRYVWLTPLKNKSSKIVKNALSKIFIEFGKPCRVQHDCGNEFEGETKHYLQMNGIKSISSRPYHPESQDKVERMHRILKRKIGFDLIRMGRLGVNWVKELKNYKIVSMTHLKSAWDGQHRLRYILVEKQNNK